MFRALLHLAPGLGSRPSLSARGQRLNTFAGIGFTIAFSFLALGGYLIAQQFANPVEIPALDLPLAALLITTALTLLLYYLLHASRKARHDIAESPAMIYWEERKVAVIRSTAQSVRSACTPAARRYVDCARIRIRRDARITPAESPESTALRGSAGDAVRVRP